MTGFWIFMFIMVVITPLIMIGFGAYFYRHTPKEINSIFGYRTTRSMKNQDTWDFAHRYCGKVWRILGWLTLLISLIAMLLTLGKEVNFIGIYSCILIGIQIIALIISIFPVESALKQTFDENGNRR